MALEPITRQEQIVAGKDLEPITRMEKFLKEYGGGGGNSAPTNWNAAEGEPGHVLNRPFWKEVVKKSLTEETTGETTVTVTTVENSGFNAALDVPVYYVPDTTNYVIFDGVEYECIPHYDSNANVDGIGSLDFSEYPFFIGKNMIVTQTAGEHTLEQYYDETVIKANYAPYLEIETPKKEDKTPYLTMEDVEKIKVAYKNGIPIRLSINKANLSVVMQINRVTNSLIFASGFGSASYGIMEHMEYVFAVKDGSLYESRICQLGSLEEDVYTYPVMYIKGSRYKITVDDNGKLTATEIT